MLSPQFQKVLQDSPFIFENEQKLQQYFEAHIRRKTPWIMEVFTSDYSWKHFQESLKKKGWGSQEIRILERLRRQIPRERIYPAQPGDIRYGDPNNPLIPRPGMDPAEYRLWLERRIRAGDTRVIQSLRNPHKVRQAEQAFTRQNSGGLRTQAQSRIQSHHYQKALGHAYVYLDRIHPSSKKPLSRRSPSFFSTALHSHMPSGVLAHQAVGLTPYALERQTSQTLAYPPGQQQQKVKGVSLRAGVRPESGMRTQVAQIPKFGTTKIPEEPKSQSPGQFRFATDRKRQGRNPGGQKSRVIFELAALAMKNRNLREALLAHRFQDTYSLSRLVNTFKILLKNPRQPVKDLVYFLLQASDKDLEDIAYGTTAILSKQERHRTLNQTIVPYGKDKGKTLEWLLDRNPQRLFVYANLNLPQYRDFQTKLLQFIQKHDSTLQRFYEIGDRASPPDSMPFYAQRVYLESGEKGTQALRDKEGNLVTFFRDRFGHIHRAPEELQGRKGWAYIPGSQEDDSTSRGRYHRSVRFSDKMRRDSFDVANDLNHPKHRQIVGYHPDGTPRYEDLTSYGLRRKWQRYPNIWDPDYHQSRTQQEYNQVIKGRLEAELAEKMGRSQLALPPDHPWSRRIRREIFDEYKAQKMEVAYFQRMQMQTNLLPPSLFEPGEAEEQGMGRQQPGYTPAGLGSAIPGNRPERGRVKKKKTRFPEASLDFLQSPSEEYKVLYEKKTDYHKLFEQAKTHYEYRMLVQEIEEKYSWEAIKFFEDFNDLPDEKRLTRRRILTFGRLAGINPTP